MPFFRLYGSFMFYNTSNPHHMRKNRLSLPGKLLLLFLLGIASRQTSAQYLFSEQFAGSAVFSAPGWQVYSPKGTIFRDTVNGLALPGAGAMHVSFTDMRSGDIDTLTLPVFTAATANDSFIFDHAHRSRNTNSDSMAIRYSTDGGITFSYLHSYAGSTTPTPATLSTVRPGLIPGKFRPIGASMWGHKGVVLPAGTNRIQLIFYSDNGNELYLDNVLIGKDPLMCTATPVAAVLPHTITACAGSPAIVASSSVIFDPYVIYQWEVSADSGIVDPWSPMANIAGINAPDLFLTTLTRSAYYRLQIICTSGGSSSISAAAHLVFDSSYNCYCRTNLGGECTTWITSVSIDGTGLDNRSDCNDTDPVNKFTYYPPSATTTGTLTAGEPYATINIGTATIVPWLTGKVGFWIDFDRSGTFDSSEFHLVNNAFTSGISSYTFAIPAAAASGYTGLRIRNLEGSSPFNGTVACSMLPNGETEDYLIYINPAPVCSGAPNPGTPVTRTPDICQNEGFTILSENVGYGLGITYEWEESDDNGITDTWTTVDVSTGSGIFTPVLTVSSIADIMYYRLKVVCNNTSDSAYSTPISIHVKPFYMCYCNETLGGDACNRGAAFISNVTIAGSSLNNTSACSNNRNSYSYFGITPTTTDTFGLDELITLSVTNTETSNKAGVWIDYNHNNIFDDTEFTLLTISSAANVPTLTSIVIPATADTGYTGMRIRATGLGSRFGSTDACSNFGTGETEDYVIYLQLSSACSGAPVAGTVNTQMSTCMGEPVTIEAPGASFGPGITYQWEVSADAGITDPWADVTTGRGFDSRQLNTPAITDTVFYRLKVLCLHSGITSYSDTIQVNIRPFYECYCKDNLGAGNTCLFNEYISNVTFTGGNLNNSSTCTSTGNLNNYTAYPPAGTATDTITTGEFITLAVTFEGEASRIGAWIDYDQSGTFDPGEFTLITATTSTGRTQLKTIELPAAALEGKTGMRIRTNCATCQLDSLDACTNFPTGETEDYIITIAPATACSGLPAAGSLPTTYLICPNKPFETISAGAPFYSGITYQWETSADNGVLDPWMDVAHAQSRRLVLPTGITTERYYRMRAVCNATDSAYTNVMHMPVDSFYNCYDAGTDLGGSACYGNEFIYNVSISHTTLDNGSACNVTPLGSRTTFPATGTSTATLIAASQYEINVSKRSVVSIGIWIDFDRSGTFDPIEFTLVTPISFGISTESATIMIPRGAVPGLTGMRVRTNTALPFGGVMAPNTAAFNYAQGETEDYVITIDTLKPVTNVMLSSIGNTDATVSWTNGNGNGRVVLAKEAATLLTNPANDTFYIADPVFASGNGDVTAAGNYIVFNGDRDTFVTVTGLNPLTQYEFYVYEYLQSRAWGIIYSIPGQMTGGTSLPVNLLSFGAAKKQNDVLLTWSTASETNNAGFSVERSADNSKWHEIGFIPGQGNAATINRYSYLDAEPFTAASLLYYRLRQQDASGNTTYSAVVKAGKDHIAIPSVQVYPNPLEETITLAVQSEAETDLHLMIRDVFGKTVSEQTRVISKGNNVFTLDHPVQLAPGIYFMQVEQQGQTHNIKITKTR